MAFVITVAQQKGGAGKTTLAANLAAAWAQTHRVAVLDIDPQRSLSRWHELRAGNIRAKGTIQLSEISGWRLAAELDRLRANHDMVIVDSPPQVNMEAKVAIRAADLVLVPVQPSLPDLWAAEATLAIATGERRRARIVLNRAPTSGTLRDQVVARIVQNGDARLVATLGNRIGFANAFALGLGVIETAPKSAAAIELQAVMAEIEESRT